MIQISLTAVVGPVVRAAYSTILVLFGWQAGVIHSVAAHRVTIRRMPLACGREMDGVNILMAILQASYKPWPQRQHCLEYRRNTT